MNKTNDLSAAESAAYGHGISFIEMITSTMSIDDIVDLDCESFAVDYYPNDPILAEYFFEGALENLKFIIKNFDNHKELSAALKTLS